MMHNSHISALSKESNTMPTSRAWIIVMAAALFFFYEFIQMNMMDAISTNLFKSLHIDAAALGDLSSYYFLANVLFLLVAGILLDRFSTRFLILFALGLCVVGTGLFGLATSFFWVAVCRFLTGIGAAFCFLSVFRLATRWFPPQKMAFVTGVVVTFAMTGGMVAQTPFEILVKSVGWRNTIFIDAGFGLIIWLIVLLVIRDHPPHVKQHLERQKSQLQQVGYMKSLRMALLRKQNWLGGLYTSLMNIPINVLGGLWGILYLGVVDHLSKIDASYITSLLFLGTIIGSPVFGWFSDRMARRKPLMIFGAITSTILLCFVLWMVNLSYLTILLLFFAIGFFSSSQIISYPLVSESSPRMVTAMSVSVVSIVTIGGIGIAQSLYGHILQYHATYRLHHVSTAYVPSDFHWAMFIFLVGYLLALAASLLVKETYCVQREDEWA